MAPRCLSSEAATSFTDRPAITRKGEHVALIESQGVEEPHHPFCVQAPQSLVLGRGHRRLVLEGAALAVEGPGAAERRRPCWHPACERRRDGGTWVTNVAGTRLRQTSDKCRMESVWAPSQPCGIRDALGYRSLT